MVLGAHVKDVLKIQPLGLQRPGVGTGGNQQSIEIDAGVVGQQDLPVGHIDAAGPPAEQRGDLLLVVEMLGTNGKFAMRLGAVQHMADHGAAVRWKGFVADQGDVGRRIQQSDGLGRTYAGNAVADNHVFHWTSPARRCVNERRNDQTTIADRLHAHHACRAAIRLAVHPHRLTEKGGGYGFHGGYQKGILPRNSIGMGAPSSRKKCSSKKPGPTKSPSPATTRVIRPSGMVLTLNDQERPIFSDGRTSVWIFKMAFSPILYTAFLLSYYIWLK